jgi:cytidine deaminase
MRRSTGWAVLLLLGFAACSSVENKPHSQWKLTQGSEAVGQDERLRGQIFRALDAAKDAGTDPSISKFQVRAATVVEHDSREDVVLGGNTEYEIPEAIHGETSVLNHVTALFGPGVTRRSVRFIAFYGQRCGESLSCGDCRDYQMVATDYEHLLLVCGQASDHTVRVRRFTECVAREENFPEVRASQIPLGASELQRLVRAAQEARQGGVTLFSSARHTGAAGLSYRGRLYRAAGADDAAFHYRYPIGGLLQQAATERDYLMRAIVVAGETAKWPHVNYRDRQYGYEASSFNRQEGKQPILLVLTDGQGKFRMTTFEDALPFAFSTTAFMPGAVAEFLKTHPP